jgi:hypothetical protein
VKRNHIIIATFFLSAATLAVVFRDAKKPVPIEIDEAVVINEDRGENAVREIEHKESAERINGQDVGEADIETVDTDKTKPVLMEVPFISQAPLGNWSDPVYQNGCEEAAIIMAMAWVKGEGAIGAEEGIRRIKDISKFEEKVFGHNIDTDVPDVVKIIKKYYEYEKIEAQFDFNADDIVKQLQEGNVILVPTFGRALKNPNYTSPGPITHMLVVTGFDDAKKEFVTNDPGTRKGEEYRYPYGILINAIWSYPSGKKHPQPPNQGEMEKSMIIVRK